MNGEAATDWKEEALGRVLGMLEVDLSSRLESFDLRFAIETYRQLFRQDLDTLGGFGPGLAEPVFLDAAMARLNGLSRLSGPALMQAVRQDRLVAQIREVDRVVEAAAREKALGGELAADRLAELDSRRAELFVLSQRLRREAPKLVEPLGELLSEAQLDCMYLLDGVDPMSLRLHRLLAGRRA